ncbi:MAG: NADP-dependent oxidoreductase, partial [Candidatus Acidiferrales bacterium]
MSERPNRQILLAERPSGKLQESHFKAVDSAIGAPGPGELLVRTILLSIDPANRAWMQGRTYREQLGAGEVMAGGALCEVIAAKDAPIPPGAIVWGEPGWQEYAVLAANRVLPVAVRGPLTHHMSALGITGLTAYFGMLNVAQPRSGETVVVSAAAGATGSVAGQIARIHGARVVGVTGSDDKNAMLERDLGFDATVNHRSQTLRQDLAAACPNGIDVYFDNVGGRVLEAVLPLMKTHGRIACCGAVSQYDSATPAPGPAGVPAQLIVKRLRMEGFLVSDYIGEWGKAQEQLAAWIPSGELKVLEDVVEGLESAPRALIGILAGDN